MTNNIFIRRLIILIGLFCLTFALFSTDITITEEVALPQSKTGPSFAQTPPEAGMENYLLARPITNGFIPLQLLPQKWTGIISAFFFLTLYLPLLCQHLLSIFTPQLTKHKMLRSLKFTA